MIVLGAVLPMILMVVLGAVPPVPVMTMQSYDCTMSVLIPIYDLMIIIG